MNPAKPRAKWPSLVLRIVTLLVVLICGIGLYNILAAVAYLHAPYESVFNRFSIQGGLPDLTWLVLGASHLVSSWWFVFAAIGLAAIGFMGWLGWVEPRAGILVALAGLLTLLVANLVLVGLMVVALLVPLMELIRSIGSAR